MLSVIFVPFRLSVILLNVVMLNVVAPFLSGVEREGKSVRTLSSKTFFRVILTN